MNQPETLRLSLEDSWQIEFPWQTDRYSHRIGWHGIPSQVESSAGWLAKSIELSDNPDWPLSPPLQQLSIETDHHDGPVALGVGMAGRCHWSASFQLKKSTGSFAAELAARLSEPPTRLGSCLEWLGETELEVQPHDHANQPSDIACYLIRFSGHTFRLTVSHGSLCKVQERRIYIFPKEAAIHKFPATVCWGYQITPQR